jgi:manganese/iron transport system permease protein
VSGLAAALADPAFRSGLAAALLVGTGCAAIGVYVVLRRMAFIGDALSHTVLPGLVVASLLGASLFGGALVAGLVTALGIGWLARRRLLREDTAIGVLFTAMFALGVLLSRARYDPHDFEHVLFGDLLGIDAGELWFLGGVTAVVLGALTLLHKELELASADPSYAEVIGIRTDRLRYLLLVLIALTVVAALRVVGVLMTSALLVTPAAAASLLTRRLAPMMALAASIAVGSGIVGLALAYRWDLASGAVIVLACTAGFGAAWALRALRRPV